MRIIRQNITLDTKVRELKKFPEFNRNTLFLLKEYGATNMEDILNIDPYEFVKMHGVGPVTMNDLFAIQKCYKQLTYTQREESSRLLDKAAQICIRKHAGQRDETGKAYFQHPMRVAMRCHKDDEKIVALLHDAMGEPDVTVDCLQAEGFPQYIIDGILSVTKSDDETYEDFISRAKKNPLGRSVLIKDIEDNLDILDLDVVSPETAVRLTKYIKAHKRLLDNESI